MNEELSKQVVDAEVKAAKYIITFLLKHKPNLETIIDIMKRAATGKLMTKELSVKDLVKKGGTIEEIPIKDEDIKILKKELNRLGVNFSIYKTEKGQYHVAFESKNVQVMNLAFKRTIAKMQKKTQTKDSIKKKLEELKERMKDFVKKDKVRNKHHEQSL